MAEGDKQGDLASLGAAIGKPGGPRRAPQFCGDIGLKIDRDGTWYYQGSPIGRKPLVKLFASVLRREEDGLYYLVTPVEKVSIEVAEAPFIAVSMERVGEGKSQRLTFRTNIDDEVEAGARHPLRFRSESDGSFTPFVLVRDRLEARLSRPVYYELVNAASDGPGGDLGIWTGGAFFAFPPAS